MSTRQFGDRGALGPEVWHQRCDDIERLVREGMAMTNASVKVCGFAAMSYIQHRYPDRWAAIQKLSSEMRVARIVSRNTERARKAIETRAKIREMRWSDSEIRAEAMIALRASGWTLRQIGQVFNMTTEGVRKTIEGALPQLDAMQEEPTP